MRKAKAEVTEVVAPEKPKRTRSTKKEATVEPTIKEMPKTEAVTEAPKKRGRAKTVEPPVV